MNLSKFSDFGLAVKTKLLHTGKNQEWLVGEIEHSTGMFIDGSYLSKILAGKRNPPKIVEAIREILDLEGKE